MCGPHNFGEHMPDLRYSRSRTLSSPSSSPSLTGVVYGSMDEREAPSPLRLPRSSVSSVFVGKGRAERDESDVSRESPLVTTFFLSVLFLVAGVADVTINRYLLFIKTFHFPLVTAVSSDAFALVLLLATSSANICWTFKPGTGSWISRVVSLGVLSCLNHALDMFGLMMLPPTIVKTIRSSKPLFAALILYISRGEKQSFPKVVCLFIVASGASLLTFKSDRGFDWIGSSCVLAATVVSAMHFVLASIVFQENEMNVLSVMLTVTSVSIVILFPFSIYYESDAFYVMENDALHTAMYCLLFSASSKFMHSILGWLLIQRTNPVYCTLLMCMKLPVVILVTVPLFHEEKTYGVFGWLGVVLAILGFSMFQYLDYREYTTLVQGLMLNQQHYDSSSDIDKNDDNDDESIGLVDGRVVVMKKNSSM